jgi:SulP family sulfate permease
MQGILPLDRKRIPLDIAAGITLAALGIPEVMGYTSIAGMPVVTGLYTILIPIAIFAVLGSSRHLVVGADSATAAIMAAGLAGMATVASDEYVTLAGMLALIVGGILILARLIRLGFIADFLSRSVLIGFLTGVGIQVAMGQVGDMLGIPAQTGGTVEKLLATLGDFAARNGTTILVSAGVAIVIFGAKAINPRIPGALIAVIGAIWISWQFDLAADGVATLGSVPGGLPNFVFPSVTWSQFTELLGTAGAIFIVVVAQSAATARAYAAKYEESFDENLDLIGLGLANASAGLTGTFVVNGSPTKTQMVTGAGGRTQLASLTTAVIVAVVLLWLTAPLQYMPQAVLATVVFIIGVELVDLSGMRRIWATRKPEFIIATITAAVVVFVGVEQAIVLAIIMSAIDHLRYSYHPKDSVLTRATDGALKSAPVAAGSQVIPGLVVYRFSASLYYANATHFNEEVLELTSPDAADVTCLVLDAVAISDIDFSAGATVNQVHGELAERGVRLVIANATAEVRSQLDRYGVTEAIGTDAYFDTVEAAIDAYGTDRSTG